MAGHSAGCGCQFCARLKRKTMTTEAWRAEHLAHLDAQNRGVVDDVTAFDFAREAFDHPSGDLYWLVCPCGAKHLTGAKAAN